VEFHLTYHGPLHVATRPTIRTLLDALRVPTGLDEIPPNAKPAPDETPFFCLLEDDALISSFKVTADRLLEQRGPSDVVLVMHVSTRARTRTPSTQWLD
jgi:hypothetical protein